ncbi:MAG: ROK family protein [Myxococcaceae bacterium]
MIDVGGTKVKVGGTGRAELIRIPSGPKMTAAQMVKEVKAALGGWKYDAVSIGFPGPVRGNKILEEPVNLGTGWTTTDFAKGFGAPVKLINDAAMQALGSYEGGNMLFLGLGTGLGSAMVLDGHVAPLELAHLPYRKGLTYEDYLGIRGLERLGKKRWRHHVEKVVKILAHGMQAGYVVLGGGQTKELKELPEGVKLGNNLHAIEGGLRLWQ